LFRQVDVVPAGGTPQQIDAHWRPPQVHAFAVVHVCPAPQAPAPQSTVTPQLSLTVPHFPAQVVVVELLAQLHTFDALHVCPAPQPVVPQSTLMPQLSLRAPHLPAQVVAIELRAQPHMFDVPAPPHVCGSVQSLSVQQLPAEVAMHF
jgi:hypothetical protein